MQNYLSRRIAKIPEKNIFLLRHGSVETDNEEKQYIGQMNLPLSTKGRRQAHFWREQLAVVPLTDICCSDLSRCMETAQTIASTTATPIMAIKELREIHLGKWEGMKFSRVKRQWPDAFLQRGADIAGYRTPGGESFTDLRQRVIPVFDKLAGQSGKNLLIVAHAGVNRIILCHLLGMPTINLFRIAQGQGAMNILRQHSDGIRLHCLNLLPHPHGCKP